MQAEANNIVTVEVTPIITNATASEPTKICFCRKCGEKLIDDSLFCRKCGTKVLSDTETY